MNWWLAFLLGAFVALPWSGWIWRRLRRAVHVLQLEEYENVRTLRWARRYWATDFQPALLAVLTIVLIGWTVLLLATIGRGNTGLGFAFAVAAVSVAGYGLIVSLKLKEPPAKKPLVVTARVKRLFRSLAFVLVMMLLAITLLGWALRAPGRAAVLAVPFVGWLCVAAGPAVAVLANLLMTPLENRYKRRYRDEASARLREVAPAIVAITGSYGKTTTKELIAAVLETKYRVQKTPQSFNTVMGITRTIREQLRDDCEVFVVEMGAYQRGDIRALCRFVGGPDVSAIVGINEQHLERMGSIENTIKAKYEIVEGTKRGGIAVFNIDNAYCKELADKTGGVSVVRVGACEHDPVPDLWADAVSINPKLMRFDVHDGDQTITVRTRMLGRHLLPNFLIALAIGKALGVDLKQAVSRLGRVEPVGHRLAVNETDGRLVIDDAYSSNVDGAHAALGLLAELPAQQRFLVTPGIVELGKVEAERNRELGAHAASVCTTVLVVGALPGRYVREGAIAAGMPEERAIACANLAAAQEHLREYMQSGDAVLFENDLPDTYG